MSKNHKKTKLVIKDKKAFVRAICLLILIIILCVGIIISIKKLNNSKTIETSSDDLIDQQEEVTAEDITFTMAVTGDIMCHNTQYNDAYDSSTGTYDFSYVFEDIKEYIQSADIAIGNLETTFAGSEVGYSSYPTFNTPEALAYNLKDLGFDVLSTANNHSLDKGYSGIESTIKFLDDAGISHTGTFTSQESQNTILYEDVKGVKIAFLSFTYGTNGISIPSGKEYCVNLIDEDFIASQLELAKQGEPDIICVSMHWGDEYKTEPNSEQEELADFLFQNGVDIILGNHSHVLEPMEKRIVTLEDGTQKECFVIYSLGNFISGQVKELTRDTAILNLTITKNGETGKISIDSATYTPLYMYKGSSSTHAYKLLDIEKEIAAYESNSSDKVSTSTYNTLVKELSNIKEILGDEF